MKQAPGGQAGRTATHATPNSGESLGTLSWQSRFLPVASNWLRALVGWRAGPPRVILGHLTTSPIHVAHDPRTNPLANRGGGLRKARGWLMPAHAAVPK